MQRSLGVCLVTLASLTAGVLAHGDPIHRTADGAYWHHDSGWIFPEKVGEFALVGMPQDVAGSTTAVAHYARGMGSARITAAVIVYPSDAGDAAATLEVETAGAASEGALALGKAGELTASRRIYRTTANGSAELVALFLVPVGDWWVRIRVSVPQAETSSERDADAFVLGQRWESLSSP